MASRTLTEPLTLEVGGMSREPLRAELRRGGIHLNPSAVTLLENAAFGRPTPQRITLVERSVAELGLSAGGTLTQILAAGPEQGLKLCPLATGPYLRLVLRDQATAPDTVMSNGQAPSGSLTLASAPLSADDAYPKGFYLRVVDDQPWLRGYRCTDEHLWEPEDRFIFQARSSTTSPSSRPAARPAGVH